MTQEQKTEIQLLTKAYVEQYASQSKAVATLRGVSEATVIQVLKDRWDLISDDMWRTIGKQVGWDLKGKWYLADTLDFQTQIAYLADAQDYGNVFALIGTSGFGKSYVSKWFASQKANIYVLECADHWNKKYFLTKLLQSMGKENTGLNVAEMLDLIVETMMKQDHPLIVLDEADKMKEDVLYFFITLYNQLKGKCGIVLTATEYLKKKIINGVRINKKGYSEIYSRIGRNFIQLNGTNKAEVTEICRLNGVTDPQTVAEIYNTYDGDLRRVERLIHKAKIMASRKKGDNAA